MISDRPKKKHALRYQEDFVLAIGEASGSGQAWNYDNMYG